MKTLTKTVLSSALLMVVIAGTSANAEGRAGNVYEKAESAEIVKVSLNTAPVAAHEVNR